MGIFQTLAHLSLAIVFFVQQVLTALEELKLYALLELICLPVDHLRVVPHALSDRTARQVHLPQLPVVIN